MTKFYSYYDTCIHMNNSITCILVTEYVYVHVFGMHTCNLVCWPLPSNQRFYRQIAGYVRGVRDPRVDQ